MCAPAVAVEWATELASGNSIFLVNDDERGLQSDYEKWLEELAPHALTSQCRPKGRLHNRTDEACPEKGEGTTPTRT